VTLRLDRAFGGRHGFIHQAEDHRSDGGGADGGGVDCAGPRLKRRTCGGRLRDEGSSLEIKELSGRLGANQNRLSSPYLTRHRSWILNARLGAIGEDVQELGQPGAAVFFHEAGFVGQERPPRSILGPSRVSGAPRPVADEIGVHGRVDQSPA
jgi:hypothetical protein